MLFNWRDRLYQWRVELNLVAFFEDQLDDGRIRILLRVVKETDCIRVGVYIPKISRPSSFLSWNVVEI